MTTKSSTLVVIEAPGKVRRLAALLRAAGMVVDVCATRGHFRNSPTSLWPLCLNAQLNETARQFDPDRLAELREKAAGRTVIVATDPDQEGDVIARDVADAIGDIAANVWRVHLHALDATGVRRAFAVVGTVDRAAAYPGDARRIVDRLIGSSCSGPGRSVGRIFTAALGALAVGDPVIGHVTLVLPSRDGGAPFVARMPVTARTHALWQQRLDESLSFAPANAEATTVHRGVPWRYADLVSVAALAPIAQNQMATVA